MGGGRRSVRGGHAGRLRWWRILLLVSCVGMVTVGCGPSERPSPSKRSTGPTLSVPAERPELLCGGGSGRACQLSLFATEPDDGVAALIARLDQATRSIDYVPFLLDEPEIIRALISAERRGVRVRLLSEPEHAKENAKALKALSAAGVQIHDASSAFGLTHAKYVLIDDSRLLQLTFNSDAKELQSRRDFALQDDDPDDVRFVASLFEADWTHAPLGAIPAGFVVSPDNADDRLPALVRTAHETIDLYAEKLEPSPLLTALMDAAQSGVTVRILADAPERRGRVPGPLMDLIRRQQIQVRVPRDLGIHAKVLLIDGTTVYFGSQNVENATAERRRELGLIFDDGSIAGRLREVFEQDWSRPADPVV